MTFRDSLSLIVLAAIWGGSFLFQRILSPQLGPIAVACLRLSIAGIALALYFHAVRRVIDWRTHWKRYAVIGIVNSAIPFALFAYAALYLPASYLSIMNSLAAAWGLLFSFFWLGETATPRKLLGLALGVTGVALITNFGPVEMNSQRLLGVVACLAATACYGLAGVYLKKQATHLDPLAIAAASQLLGGLVLLPLWPITAREITLPWSTIIPAVLALALLCSGVAYLLYYSLVARYGPTRALTVTFLIPLFGVLWGVLFLGEPITASMVLGAALVIGGTYSILRAPRGR